ncbi:hypothetical protein MD484_g781, partial [Candolleomyces efflorescens]
MTTLIVRLLPKVFKNLSPNVTKFLPILDGALLTAGLTAASLINPSLTREKVEGDIKDFPPITPNSDIPDGTFPAPSNPNFNEPPWVSAPLRPRPNPDPTLPHDPNRVEPGPNHIPLEPYNPRAPHNSPRGSESSGEQSDPWGEHGIDRERGNRGGNGGEPGGGDNGRGERPREEPPNDPYEQWLIILGIITLIPWDDELWQKWRTWIQLFRAWRHDVYSTSKELNEKAPEPMKTVLHTVLDETIKQIVDKPKKSYPMKELSQDLSKIWYDQILTAYLMVRNQEWAKDLAGPFEQEFRMMYVLNSGLNDIANKIIEKQKERWVSHDFPGDPTDVTKLVTKPAT